ncbi:Protein kinase-like protein [Moritella sp. JT01]|uniref:phosphotransferase family protein n=1 Tax=Moritella sp. JT01 TaxID=756698 RepID=UPI00079A917A|nr:hypothetical protein [Moritella sp. JT01]KXO13408.1 Protein kinase-like protein [Moritella sp. JT01]
MKQKELSQMGEAQVYLTEYQGVQCIQKINATSIEVDFYKLVAPKLRAIGVGIPELFDNQGRDLFIEYIPNPFTLTELIQTSEMYEQLLLVHNCNEPYQMPIKQHKWEISQTDSALLALNIPKSCENLFHYMQKKSSILFESENYISGDTNSGNWGRRNDGSIVLFDWERFGKGSPAIDLAPLVQGMGNHTEYSKIVECYLKNNSNHDGSELFKQLIIAKAWIVIEVVNLLIERSHPETSKCIDWYNKNIPSWLSEMEHAL